MSKKVVILCMSDHTPCDDMLIETIEQTYAKKIIDSEVEGFSFYSCISMSERMKNETMHQTMGIIDNDCHSVFVPVSAKPEDSFKKLVCVLRTLHNEISNADYIMLTDTRTYVNVDMMNAFVNMLNNFDETIYCSQIRASKYYSGPYKYCAYAGGSMLIPMKFYYDVLTDVSYRNTALKVDMNKNKDYDLLRQNVMNYAIGLVVNSHLISE